MLCPIDTGDCCALYPIDAEDSRALCPIDTGDCCALCPIDAVDCVT